MKKRGCVQLIVCEVGEGEGRGERNSDLVKWGYRAQRGKGTESGDRFILRTGKAGSLLLKEAGKRKKRGIVLPPDESCFSLMTQRGFQLKSPCREEFMVSFRGRGADGRTLNALG